LLLLGNFSMSLRIRSTTDEPIGSYVADLTCNI
jgi:hypothetical protein